MFYEGAGVADGRHPFFSGVTGHFGSNPTGGPAGGTELVVIHSFMLPQMAGGRADLAGYPIFIESLLVRAWVRLYNQENRAVNIAERLATKLHLSR